MNPLRCVLILAVLGGAPEASATLVVSARVRVGSTWRSELLTDGNIVARIELGIFLSFTDEGADLRACRFNVVGNESRRLDEADRAIAISGGGLGRQAPYNLGSNPLSTFFTPGVFRIDEAGDAANNPDVGILCTQPLPPVDASHLILLYRFDFLPAPWLTGVGVTITPGEVVAAFDLAGGGFSPAIQPDRVESATLVFVPAPSTLVLGAAALIGAVRRRRAC